MAGKSRTNVFVVGAGASAEFGMPTGKVLLDQISNLAHRETYSDRFGRELRRPKVSEDLSKALQTYLSAFALKGQPEMSEKADQLDGYALWLAENAILAPSIDNLLHTHRDNADIVSIGKMMIVASLLSAEKRSSIYLSPGERINSKIFSYRPSPVLGGKRHSPTETWLGELFWLLAELRTFGDFLDALGNITFISFNYDRCIEHFLANAASSYFRLDRSAVEAVLQTIKVVHPYGSLGDLWVDDTGIARGYGDLPQDIYLTSLGISTFTEEMELERGKESDGSTKIRAAFETAEVVFFLGFGFIDLNLKLLFKHGNYSVKRVVGTCKGLSSESKLIVQRKLAEKLLFGNESAEARSILLAGGGEGRIPLIDGTCRDLMWEHQFSLRE